MGNPLGDSSEGAVRLCLHVAWSSSSVYLDKAIERLTWRNVAVGLGLPAGPWRHNLLDDVRTVVTSLALKARFVVRRDSNATADWASSVTASLLVHLSESRPRIQRCYPFHDATQSS